MVAIFNQTLRPQFSVITVTIGFFRTVKIIQLTNRNMHSLNTVEFIRNIICCKQCIVLIHYKEIKQY